jgi:methylmalonyl-CoA/ethylmalonyl-CoA epimerase
MRAAFADVGNVQLELIQPLDERSIYAEFLREQGEGFHHLAMDVEDHDATVAMAKSKGSDLIQEGKVTDTGFAYLDTRKTMLFISEIYKWPEKTVAPESDKT